MIRTDIITTVGRKYLTSNIENEEFSYGKALKEIGKNYTDYLSDDAKRTYKDLDIRFANDKLSILIETKQNLSGKDLKDVPVIIPLPDCLKNFNSVVSLAFKKILCIEKENAELVSLRDYLLPLLMNGQVTIGE